MKKILLIIPAYNEEKNIDNVVAQIETFNDLSEHIIEYIIINDGSTDKTLEICLKNHYQVIDLPCNLGIGGAVHTGYKYAFQCDYDIAVQFDGDGQHDVQYIERLIEPLINKDANMVIGSRFLGGGESEFKSSKLRRVGIILLSFLLYKLTKVTIRDMTSGFRAVDKTIIKKFAAEYPYEYPEPVTNFSLSNSGYRVQEVPVNMFERKHGKSSIGKLKSIYYMMNVILLFVVMKIFGEDDLHA